VTRLSDGQVGGLRDSVSPNSRHVVPDRSRRAGRFAQLALGLDDLLVAITCLRHALLSAMIVAYGRLFPHAGDEARGLPGSYEPEGQLRVPHLHLLGMRNLMRQHCESTLRRVLVGPARGLSAESLFAPGDKIIRSGLSDPLGPLDLQQVDGSFQYLRAYSGGHGPALRRTVHRAGHSAAGHRSGARSGMRPRRHLRRCRRSPCPVTSETRIRVLLSGSPAIGRGLPPRAT